MSICAYCKQDRPPTREHVVPSFMYAFMRELQSKVIGWNEVAGQMVGGEGTVKDVCGTCNNGVLAELDAYAKGFLVNAGIMVGSYASLTLAMAYNYDKLVRWLLKVAYNSARTDGAHRNLFEPLVPFVMGTEPRPHRSELALLAYLAAPTELTAEQCNRHPYRDLIKGTPRFNPFLARICYGGLPGVSSYTLRMNIFGPLVFFMMFFPAGTKPGHAAGDVRFLAKMFPHAREIRGNSRFVELHAGSVSWLDLYQMQVARVHAMNAERYRA